MKALISEPNTQKYYLYKYTYSFPVVFLWGNPVGYQSLVVMSDLKRLKTTVYPIGHVYPENQVYPRQEFPSRYLRQNPCHLRLVDDAFVCWNHDFLILLSQT